jgi:hypothetical protein
MLEPQGNQFEQRYGTKLERKLGFGRDGTVMYTSRASAVKLFSGRDAYLRERDAYLLLQSKGVSKILDHQVPELIRADDELLVIEMSIVEPPFLLDFASAYREDEAPDFSEEVWEDWRAQKAEQFGDRWPEVERVLDEFRRVTGFILLDVNPGNVTFADQSGR